MKVKALDSFATGETGMVHAGQEIDTTDISQDRLDAWAARGFIPKVKKEQAPKNKAEPVAPANKTDPLDHDNNGRRGGAAKPSGKGK
ncbi:hypothetical protein [Devosia sp. SL43]|uniref:hypothetical protein n=1 Tax=Devosia sp. SL43 TaxID=2806348 RepID=UPI001F368BA7|nr:hypothetical protein [Devosia sp. SL43]UJW87968.1 hypothetical protein IM737_20655 [Devosia sp. SL43]